MPGLPNYFGATLADVPQSVHAAHTTPRGIQTPDNMDSGKAARLLNKLAKSIAKSRVVKPKSPKPQTRKKKR